MFRSKELADLLEYQLVNFGFARTVDGLIKYKVDGCRMSGDMNTALGNCMIMCALVWTFMTDLRRTSGECPPFEFVNNGDDVVLFVEQRDSSLVLDQLPQWFLEMGFTMKVEDPVFRLEHIEFCQMVPLEVKPGDWTMVR